MDKFLFIAPLILVFVGVPIGLGLLFYFVPKKLGYPQTAKYLTIFYGLFVLVISFLLVFEDQLFTKNDAKVDMPTKLTTPCRSNLQHFCRYV
jgi:hypothetical protein